MVRLVGATAPTGVLEDYSQPPNLLHPQHSLGGHGAGTLIGMEQDTPQTQVTEQVEVIEAAVTEELLVEEISIDGMCGVY
jgi:mycofactocin precursor